MTIGRSPLLRQDTQAWFVLGAAAMVAACSIALYSVALRDLDQGTDTHVYAGWYLSLRGGEPATRFEPLFVGVSRLASALGLGVLAWQGLMFALLLAGAALATRAYARLIGVRPRHLAPLAMALLLLSPVLVNAAINATRQGLAAFPVIVALVAFQQRRWLAFVVAGAVATGMHYSSLLYLVLAPVLLLPPRALRLVCVAAFACYACGLTMAAVRVASPALYAAVMAYGPNAVYRSGVRLDFAVFSFAWFALPLMLARTVRQPQASGIVRAQGIYLVLLLPFLLVGWGNYSNRYLLPAWLFASIVVAAVCVESRLPPLRHPLTAGALLLLAGGVFALFVAHGVML